MIEITISTRVPKELEKQLEDYMEVEHLEKASAIRRLLFKSLQAWREEYALKLLEEGKTTISKAAEIAGLDIWSFMALIRKFKIAWIKDDVIDEDLQGFR